MPKCSRIFCVISPCPYCHSIRLQVCHLLRLMHAIKVNHCKYAQFNDVSFEFSTLSAWMISICLAVAGRCQATSINYFSKSPPHSLLFTHWIRSMKNIPPWISSSRAIVRRVESSQQSGLGDCVRTEWNWDVPTWRTRTRPAVVDSRMRSLQMRRNEKWFLFWLRNCLHLEFNSWLKRAIGILI